MPDAAPGENVAVEDVIIQRLFRAGLAVHSALPQVHDAWTTDMLRRAIGHLALAIEHAQAPAHPLRVSEYELPLPSYPGDTVVLPIEAGYTLAELAHNAASSGQVVYLTEDGRRLAAIVIPDVAAAGTAAIETLNHAADLDAAAIEAAQQGL
jgi:hypothetical protein